MVEKCCADIRFCPRQVANRWFSGTWPWFFSIFSLPFPCHRHRRRCRCLLRRRNRLRLRPQRMVLEPPRTGFPNLDNDEGMAGQITVFPERNL